MYSNYYIKEMTLNALSYQITAHVANDKHTAQIYQFAC